jgi:citrate synthase
MRVRLDELEAVRVLDEVAQPEQVTRAEHDEDAVARSRGPHLADAGVPPTIMRGFALISRCAGLVGHVAEMWHAVEKAVPYDEDP